MTAGTPGGSDDSLPEEAVKRANALETLRAGPMTRAELVDALDVSRTTVHRTVGDLDDRNLLVQNAGHLELSALGETVADEVVTYRRRLDAANRLEPFLETLSETTVDLDVGQFEDAHVTEMNPTDPYAPIGRFMGLLRESETLSGFDTTTIAPIFVEEIREEILGGMETDVVYLPAVAEEMLSAYPDAIEAAIERGQLTLSTHEDLPFGLAIFDGRVGLGGYDHDTGLLRVFVDTDDPEVRAWAEELYATYRDDADPVTLPASEPV